MSQGIPLTFLQRGSITYHPPPNKQAFLDFWKNIYFHIKKLIKIWVCHTISPQQVGSLYSMQRYQKLTEKKISIFESLTIVVYMFRKIFPQKNQNIWKRESKVIQIQRVIKNYKKPEKINNQPFVCFNIVNKVPCLVLNGFSK
jgi:hypothetical protein